METTLQLATSQGVVLPPRSSAAKNVLSNLQASLTLMLPDDDVGAILGRKGQNLVDIQQVRAGSRLACAAAWGHDAHIVIGAHLALTAHTKLLCCSTGSVMHLTAIQ